MKRWPSTLVHSHYGVAARTEVQAVACPTCGAQAGEDCKTLAGNWSLPHKHRVAVWRRSGADAIERYFNDRSTTVRNPLEQEATL